MTDPRPANVPWLTPYLAVRNPRATIDFFKAAFGFELRDALDDAGAKSLTAPQDPFRGDRFAQIEDLDGYRWALARHLEQ
ncbi:hypothetical protein DID96_14350 [Burkholderia sp. Bp8963]|uniref:VOC family protein n=1 Tax=Burkholderia sp. Bp8963 TaxID=2184547 RepID=UPI000F59C3B2|nr:hypothetical protein [Burkholderia sp. Bp8963]RQS70825.1 hypothetical protein DID96_14350 [Burkholderia sp. Bp8963]